MSYIVKLAPLQYRHNISKSWWNPYFSTQIFQAAKWKVNPNVLSSKYKSHRMYLIMKVSYRNTVRVKSKLGESNAPGLKYQTLISIPDVAWFLLTDQCLKSTQIPAMWLAGGVAQSQLLCNFHRCAHRMISPTAVICKLASVNLRGTDNRLWNP